MRYVGLAAVAAFLLVIVETSRAATLFPFLQPVRAEITNQFAIASVGTNRSSAADARLLRQARNAIERRGRATLAGDVQTLSTVATLLSRTSSRAVFDPLLQNAVTAYLDVLTSNAANLQTNLAALPPSDSLIAAQSNLDSALSSLDQAAAASSPLVASRLLTRAAVRLAAIQGLITRLTRERNRPEAMTAFIGGTVFRSGPKTSAFFSPFTGALTISGSENVGLESRSITISLLGAEPGTTVHNFGGPGSGNFATVSIRGTNSVGYASSSGTAIVTIDAAGRTASGTFSFSATSGSPFDAPIQVSGGSFFARLDDTSPVITP